MTTLTLVPTNQTNTDDTPMYIDNEHVFNTLVENRGHMQLTCEQLSRQYNSKITNINIIQAVKDRLPELKQYMEALAALELFSLMPVMSKVLSENMSALEPSDAVNAFMGLHKLISAKVDTQKIDVNHTNELVWRQIPADLREAWLSLETSEAG